MSPLRTIAILAALFCVAYATAPIVENEVAEPAPLADEDYRLPLIIKPISYAIKLQPYLMETDAKPFTFEGDVEIEIKTNEETNKIKLHSKRLEHKKTEYYSRSEPMKKLSLTVSDTNNVTDIITLTTEKQLMPGEVYVLHFVYTGLMEDDMHGFYRSSYVDKKNNTNWLGSTQFQTNHARRAFPAFDEPLFKAIFNLTLVRHKSMKTVSNTRLMSSTVNQANKDWIIDVYTPTPKMSCYIVAFIFSNFNERFNGEFGILARPEFYDQTEYAHEVGQKLLNEFDEYLKFPYYQMGIDKMHMAAIPDFSAGAMENWGLLTYRERGLLYDPKSTTLSAKQYIAAVIAHEQAHMWFGDLITCKWWSYTWLNEGFARYFQYYATAAVEPSYHIDMQFTVDQVQSVMGMDATNNTNPMSDKNTFTPADLGRMFNSISYNKGATFIRQVRHILGDENFKASLQQYILNNHYKNTEPPNLFSVWKEHWPQNSIEHADQFFELFTEQVGYPVVTVNVSAVANRQGFEISQKRFLLKDNDGSDPSLSYIVPFTYTTSEEKDFHSTTPKLYLNDTKVVHNHGKNFSWVIANIQQAGYYRVNYDEHYWHGIHHALLSKNWSGIPELNRAQVVDDLLNLARASVIKYELAFAVLEYLATETHYLPWTAAFNGFSYLAIRLGNDTKDFGNYILQSTEKAYSWLGFEEKTNDTSLDIYNRAKILAWSCKYGNSDCIWKAKNYFSKMHETEIPVNIRGTVYCTAMREGTEADFDHMFHMYKTTPVATQETLILNAMGCVKHEKLVEKYFNIVLSNDVRRQDKSSALASLYSENNENVSPVFKLVTDNFEKLATAMGNDYGAVASVISNIASRFTEESQEKDLKDFNTKNKAKFGSSSTVLEKAEKTVSENLAWSANKLGAVRTYLKQRSGGSATTNAFTALTLVLVAVFAMLLK